LTLSQRPPPAKTRRAPGSCATALVSGARTLTTRSSRDRDGKASRPPTPSGRKISTAASWASPAAATGSARRASHTCFEVADYDAMKATLEREGIKWVENTQPGGRVQLLCNDPDGNTLEFQPATV